MAKTLFSNFKSCYIILTSRKWQKILRIIVIHSIYKRILPTSSCSRWIIVEPSLLVKFCNNSFWSVELNQKQAIFQASNYWLPSRLWIIEQFLKFKHFLRKDRRAEKCAALKKLLTWQWNRKMDFETAQIQSSRYIGHNRVREQYVRIHAGSGGYSLKLAMMALVAANNRNVQHSDIHTLEPFLIVLEPILHASFKKFRQSRTPIHLLTLQFASKVYSATGSSTTFIDTVLCLIPGLSYQCAMKNGWNTV